MSLDVDLMITQTCSVFTQNITHNLGKMASAVMVDEEKSLSLYNILWRPDESGFVYAKEISDYLDLGWNILLSDPEEYKRYNPENGWGSYDGLCNFVYRYRNATWDNPDAELRVSR
jgi:hypothetical protein